jgi:hypothetical protein
MLRPIKLWLDRRNDCFRNLVLHREDIGKLAIVALCPEMTAGRDVVELRGDADFGAQAFSGRIGRNQLSDALRVGTLVLLSSLTAGTAFAAEGGRNPRAEHAAMK